VTITELTAWVRRQTLVTTAELSDADLMALLQQGLLDTATRWEWPWCYAEATIALVGGTPTYNLPADTMWIKALIHDGEGANARLARTTIEAVQAEFGDSVGDSDLPHSFYLENAQVTFIPTPDAAKTVNVHYYATPDLADFDTGADEPPFHPAFHVLLAEYVSALVWESLENDEKMILFTQKYDTTVGRMATFYASTLPAQPVIVGGGIVRHHLPWSPYLSA
jgi:hypothetical protein